LVRISDCPSILAGTDFSHWKKNHDFNFQNSYVLGLTNNRTNIFRLKWVQSHVTISFSAPKLFSDSSNLIFNLGHQALPFHPPFICGITVLGKVPGFCPRVSTWPLIVKVHWSNWMVHFRWSIVWSLTQPFFT